MKKILIHAKGAIHNSLFDHGERDGYNDPLIYLRERCATLGYELRTSDSCSLEDCEWVFFYDALSVLPHRGVKGKIKMLRDRLSRVSHFRDLYKECINAGMKDRIALFLWEAPAVISGNWDHELHELFPLIFTWNDRYIDGKKYHKIYWPQTRKFPNVKKTPFERRKLLVNISMNKYSRHPKELYSARRDAVRYFETSMPNDFDLFGVGWNVPATRTQRLFPSMVEKHTSYRGTVKNKWDVLPMYRYALCYENVRDEPGWITEKIFDCMRAGCVPIYWGASNISDYVDAGAFIDRRKFRSNAELKQALINMGEREYENYLQTINYYLESPRFKKFLPSNFADTIIAALKL